MAKYSKKAQEKIRENMREMKEGVLRSGSGKKVTSRKQAIAIGISEAREAGAKVPKKKTAKKKAAKSPAKKSAAKKATGTKRAKKSAVKKPAAKRSSPKKRSTKK